jgi:hypothetical protein
MKVILSIQIIVILILSGCSIKQNRTPEIVLNDSAFIKLTIQNYSDTTIFYYKVTPILPNGCVTKKNEITHNGIYLFSYKTITPDKIEITLRKDFQTYLIPGDTLKIVANLDPQVEADKAIKIEGEYGEITNFFDKKHKILRYWDIRKPLSNFSNQSLALEKAFALSDSVFQSEIDFLNNYNKSNHLPDWFYQIMKMEIDYYKVQIRPYLIEYRKYAYHEKISDPGAYYTFDKVPTYNPKAILSKNYYTYLDIYFGIKHEDDLEGKSGIDRTLPLFERSIPDARITLKGDILEYYLASRLSDLFGTCRQTKELEKVDSVYSSIKNQFTHNEIIKVLNTQRDYIANFLAFKIPNIPFTYKTINLEDKQ